MAREQKVKLKPTSNAVAIGVMVESDLVRREPPSCAPKRGPVERTEGRTGQKLCHGKQFVLGL